VQALMPVLPYPPPWRSCAAGSPQFVTIGAAV
jgi:hypothetical protein